MRAATVKDGAIGVAEHPDPEPGSGEVLVRVRAAGLNAADLLQRQGFYPAPPGSPPDIPGLEMAGEVVALGLNTSRFAVGDRVMALLGGGGQAELAVVHERVAMHVPDGVDWQAAGGFPETFTTAHDALFTQCGLGMGERLLVHGAAGGVGTAAVQLARRPARGSLRRSATPSYATRSRLGCNRSRCSRRLRRARPLRRHPRAHRRGQHGDQPERAGNRRPHQCDRRWRRCQRRDQPSGADGRPRPHPRVHAAGAPARSQGRRGARRSKPTCYLCWRPAAYACRWPRRSRSMRSSAPTNASPAAGSWGSWSSCP